MDYEQLFNGVNMINIWLMRIVIQIIITPNHLFPFHKHLAGIYTCIQMLYAKKQQNMVVHRIFNGMLQKCHADIHSDQNESNTANPQEFPFFGCLKGPFPSGLVHVDGFHLGVRPTSLSLKGRILSGHPYIWMVKTMVSCRCSLQPIHWHLVKHFALFAKQ